MTACFAKDIPGKVGECCPADKYTIHQISTAKNLVSYPMCAWMVIYLKGNVIAVLIVDFDQGGNLSKPDKHFFFISVHFNVNDLCSIENGYFLSQMTQ